MILRKISFLLPGAINDLKRIRHCHSVFEIKHIIHQCKPENITIEKVQQSEYEGVLDIVKKYFLSENIFVRERNMNLYGDRAFDEYLMKLLQQGNTFSVKAEDGEIAGVCVNYLVSPDEPKELRDFAFHRQDPNTKDFLYYTAKLMETPNLWKLFEQSNVFEIKMLVVVPKHRRQGLATMLVERSKQHAKALGHDLLRLECINPLDHKVAESSMLHCIVKYPLSKLSGPHLPFLKSSSIYDTLVQVYLHIKTEDEHKDREIIKLKQEQLEENILE